MLLPYPSIYPIRRSVELNLPSIDHTVSNTYNVINYRDRAGSKINNCLRSSGQSFPEIGEIRLS
jgi:hypothetical protein